MRTWWAAWSAEAIAVVVAVVVVEAVAVRVGLSPLILVVRPLVSTAQCRGLRAKKV